MKNFKQNLVIGGIFTISLLVLFGVGCRERWIGFYYPSKSDLSTFTKSPELSSLEECRSWVEQTKGSMSNHADAEDDYECGKNCSYDKNFDGYICQETVR